MAKKVVVFNEIVSQLTEVIEFFERTGAELSYCVDGKDAYEMISSQKPDMGILSVAMPGLSGIEITRRVKIDDGNSNIKIILISDFTNESLKNRALDAECDAYMTMDQIPKSLLEYVEKVLKEPPRMELRVHADREIILVSKSRKIKTRSINLSRSGLLCATDETCNLGEEFKVVIKTDSGENMEITGIVARVMDLPAGSANKTGLGVRFRSADDKTVAALDAFIDLLKGDRPLEFKGEKMDLKPLIDFLLSEDAYFAELLGNMMRGGGPPEGADGSSGGQAALKKQEFYLPKLGNWEIGAFGGGTEEVEVYLSVIRRMVMLYIKFENLTKVLNNIPYSDSEDERTLFSVLESAFEIGSTTEKEAEQLLNSEISMRTVGLSSQIAKTRNKYIDGKIKLVKGLLERYQPIIDKKPNLQETVNKFAEIFENYKKESMDKKEELVKSIEEKKEITKEGKIKLKVPEVPKEEKMKRLMPYIVMASIVLVLSSTIFVYLNFFESKIDLTKYVAPKTMKSGKMVNDVLNFTCEDFWNPKRDKAVTAKYLKEVYEKTKSDRIIKIKILDSNGKIIGMIMGSPDKTTRTVVY